MADSDDPTTPLHWPWALSAAPLISSEATRWHGALIRYWSGTSSVMVQPPLDHHYIVIHLGGAKCVSRRQDGPAVTTVAECGSLTLVPAGTAYRWKTEGPIAFAHVYLRPDQLEEIAERELASDGSGISLIEKVGCRDPLLEPLFTRMLDELSLAEQGSALLLDSLFESFAIRLVRNHSSVCRSTPAPTASLAPHRLRRVLDYVEVNLASDIRLSDLVTAAGSSQSHFSRSFRLATGVSPYRFLLARRMDYARVLLLSGDETITQIGARCGFNSRREFSTMFKRYTGVRPAGLRAAHGISTLKQQNSGPQESASFLTLAQGRPRNELDIACSKDMSAPPSRSS